MEWHREVGTWDVLKLLVSVGVRRVDVGSGSDSIINLPSGRRQKQNKIYGLVRLTFKLVNPKLACELCNTLNRS